MSETKQAEAEDTDRTIQFISKQFSLICSPVLLIVGTVGNVLSVVVMTRKRMWNTHARCYLIVLAVVNIACLYVGLLRHVIISEYNYDIRNAHWFVCKVCNWSVK